MASQAFQPHNLKTAATWNAGGQHYNRISQTMADSIEHCVIRLAPRPGERVLDVATVGRLLPARISAAHGGQRFLANWRLLQAGNLVGIAHP